MAYRVLIANRGPISDFRYLCISKRSYGARCWRHRGDCRPRAGGGCWWSSWEAGICCRPPCVPAQLAYSQRAASGSQRHATQARRAGWYRSACSMIRVRGELRKTPWDTPAATERGALEGLVAHADRRRLCEGPGEIWRRGWVVHELESGHRAGSVRAA